MNISKTPGITWKLHQKHPNKPPQEAITHIYICVCTQCAKLHIDEKKTPNTKVVNTKLDLMACFKTVFSWDKFWALDIKNFKQKSLAQTVCS